MADIRCSKCQTLNSEDAAVCKKCGQPLSDGSISWLDNLRGDSDSSTWEEPETGAMTGEEAQPNDEIPDWLQRIRQRNQDEQAQDGAAPAGQEPSENVPDWLREIQQSSSATPAESTDGEDDWLQNLRGPEPAAPAAGETPPTAGRGSAEQEDNSDWMQSLEAWKMGLDESSEKASAGQSGGNEMPTPPPASKDEDNQDWLGKLSQQDAGQNPAEESDMSWLANLQAAADAAESSDREEPATSGEEMDWMSRLGGEPSTGEETQSPFADANGGSNAFSWDNSLPAEEPAPSQPAETPDWLSQFAAEDTPAADSQGFSLDSRLPAEEPAPSQPAETPDWLSQFAGSELPAAGNEPSPAASFESDIEPPAEDLPDWLSGFSEQGSDSSAGQAQLQPQPGSDSQSAPAEGVPDWLKQYTPGEEPAKPIEHVTPISEEPQAESFSWQSLGISTGKSDALPADSGTALPFAGANLPEWLDEIGGDKPRLPYDQELIPPAEPLGASETSAPFAKGELPEWLDESGPGQPAAQSAGQAPEEGGEAPLEAADLPSWLQSMRPIETVAPKPISAEDKRIEKAGPLAGLSGVLPTEDLVGQYIKPPLYSIKLHVSEKQRVHASLIESLVSEETQAQPIPAERSEAPHRVLRFLVAILLILAILLPMLNFLPAFPAPQILPQELIAFQQTLSDESILPQGSPVLLALEYEPGLSGEMQTTSEAIIRQLAERNVRLTVISTSPTGPILAQSLLDRAAFDPAQVVNLGYLAGGSTGLQSFGLSPVQAAPATLQGQFAPWNEGVLAGVSRLSDFAVTIVLTDDPDKGRTWVEQIQPALNGRPMLMVSSAQAAPLLLPYYNSGQVKGIVSGISGAAGYENLVQSNGTASLLNGSYQYGMLLAALLILVGGLVTGIISSITRGKAEKEA